ncbi:MAG: EAL domain-containing protein [Betaproteobacteria bacterium]|nr:EAL domain-containing protein [Betaproteobacteria bacterium]
MPWQAMSVIGYGRFPGVPGEAAWRGDGGDISAGEERVKAQDVPDGGGLAPCFQPIRELVSGGFPIHALLTRPDAGDALEEAAAVDTAYPGGREPIAQALAQMGRQRYQGLLFISLSTRLLFVDGGCARVSRLAQAARIGASRIVFEITGREALAPFSRLQAFVRDASIHGFRFAIGHFGFADASFQSLRHLPVDYLKIEGELIRRMVHDDVCFACVKSIVALARHLDVRTVAERVEDADTLLLARHLRIDYVQGDHVARPSPVIRSSSPEPALS